MSSRKELELLDVKSFQSVSTDGLSAVIEQGRLAASGVTTLLGTSCRKRETRGREKGKAENGGRRRKEEGKEGVGKGDGDGAG